MFYGNVNSKENPAVYPVAIQKADVYKRQD